VSLFSRRSAGWPGATADELIPRRPPLAAGTAGAVTPETALRHSAVWACLRLRANLISTMPVDLYRKVQGVQVEVPKPPVLMNPGGERVDMQEWLYSSQFDLDRSGNAVGLITARDGMGFPARIELVPIAEVSVRMKGGVLKYRIAGTDYDPSEVWHEKQYTVSGLPVGLSPVAYAAWSIGEYLSIQDFAASWYGNGAIPQAHLRNTVKKTLTQDEAAAVKRTFKTAVEGGDMFVSGADWEYKPITAEQTGNAWIEAKNFSIADIARFFDVPGDLIDAAVSTGNITYANVTQRNLQFLIMHLGPAIIRRENALSRLTSRPRFVKLNTDALLRMDPATRATTTKTRIDSRTLAPSEARELEDLRPFTDEQVAEFDRLFGPAKAAPAKNPPAPQPGSPPEGASTS
jgi:HK97 family phage portal protein